MQFGVSIGNFGGFGPRGDVQDMLGIAERADLLGFDSVWVADHIFMPADIESRYPYNDTGISPFAYHLDIYDPLAMIAAMAVRTKRVRLGTSVLIIPYRNPLVLAKMLATLDQLSHGRVILGVGAGWMAEEFEALGIGQYYPVRGSVTDEWIRICLKLWTSDGPASFHGKFHSFDDVGPGPQPVQKPHIPLWIGGTGDVAHRRVARYGDGYHPMPSTPQQVSEQLQSMRREVEKRGRDPGKVVVSLNGPGIVIGGEYAAPEPGIARASGSKQQIIDRLAEYAKVGLQHCIVRPTFAGQTETTPASTMEAMQYMAEEILPALR